MSPAESWPQSGCGQLTINRWGRVVVVASFLTFLLYNGVTSTFGAFMPIFLREFSNSSGLLGWVVSSAIAVENFAGPVANVVVRRTGCRRAVMIGGALAACGTTAASFATSVYQLFICLGLITGLGGSIIHVAVVIAVGKFYSRHYTVANGIAYAGPGAGVFVFPPLIEYLINNYGWRGSLIIEGAIVSNVIVLGALFRPASWFKSHLHRSSGLRGEDGIRQSYEPLAINDQESVNVDGNCEDKPSGSGISGLRLSLEPENIAGKAAAVNGEQSSSKSSSLRQRCRGRSRLTQTNAPAMLAMFVACVFHTAGYSGISVHLVNQAVSSGMSSLQASILLSCVGIGSLVGRLTHGWFLSRKYITASWMYTFSLLISVVATLILPLMTTSFGGMIASVTAAGLCSGVYFSLVAVLLRELVGILYLGFAFGVSLFCSGVGTTLGGYVIGILKDVTGSYCVPYFLVSASFTVAAIFSLPRPISQWYRARKNRANPGETV